jgi:hypothetical protein
MAALKVLASISLTAFAIAAQSALAANDGQPGASAPSTTSPGDAAGQPNKHARGQHRHKHRKPTTGADGAPQGSPAR